jgi:hypothetical protein
VPECVGAVVFSISLTLYDVNVNFAHAVAVPARDHEGTLTAQHKPHACGKPLKLEFKPNILTAEKYERLQLQGIWDQQMATSQIPSPAVSEPYYNPNPIDAIHHNFRRFPQASQASLQVLNAVTTEVVPH